MIELENDEKSYAASEQTLACLRLWAAVLEVAINDFRRGGKDLKDSAMHYIFKDNEVRTGSFSWICLLFNRDPNTTREYIFPNWRKDILHQVPKPRRYVHRVKPDFTWTASGITIEIPQFGVTA